MGLFVNVSACVCVLRALLSYLLVLQDLSVIIVHSVCEIEFLLELAIRVRTMLRHGRVSARQNRIGVGLSTQCACGHTIQ